MSHWGKKSFLLASVQCTSFVQRTGKWGRTLMKCRTFPEYLAGPQQRETNPIKQFKSCGNRMRTIYFLGQRWEKQLLRGRPRRSFKHSRKLYRDSCRMLDIICRSSQSSPYVTYSQNSCASPSPSRTLKPPFQPLKLSQNSRDFAKFSELIKLVKRGIDKIHFI